MAELPVPQSTFVGRPSTGDLKAMTPAEALTLLNIPGVDETSTDTTKDKLTSNDLTRKSLVHPETTIIWKDGANYHSLASGESGSTLTTNTDFVDLLDATLGSSLNNKKILVKAGDYTLTKTLTIPKGDYGVWDSRGSVFRYTPTTGDAVIWKGGQAAVMLFGRIDTTNGTTGSALRIFPDVATSTLKTLVEFQTLQCLVPYAGKGLFVDTTSEGVGVSTFRGGNIQGFVEGLRHGTDGDSVIGGANNFIIHDILNCTTNLISADNRRSDNYDLNIEATNSGQTGIKVSGNDHFFNVIMGAASGSKMLVIDSGASHNTFKFHPNLNRFQSPGGATWEDNSGNRTNVINGANNPKRGNDNVVINGQMQVNQIGTVAGIGATDVYGAADMWKYRQSGTPPGRLTSSVISVSSGNWLQYDVTTAEASLAATSLYTIEHAIEATNFHRFRFGTFEARDLVISFEHRHQQTGTYCVALANSAENRVYTIEYTQDSAGADEYEEFSIKPDAGGTWVTTGNGIGLRVIFVMAAGENHNNYTPLSDTWASTFKATANQFNTLASTANFFRIRNVQVELGETATEFQHEERSQTLRKCQRYLWKSFDHDTAPAQNAGLTGALTRLVSSAGVATQGLDLSLPVPMRTTPTATFYNPSAANALWRNVTDGSDSGAAALRNFGERGGGIDQTQVAADGVSDECAIHLLLDARL